jgi:hypothetical protein
MGVGKKAMILLIGIFPKNFISLLKEIAPDFDVEEALPQNYSDDSLMGLIYQEMPVIIFISGETFKKGETFFLRLKGLLPLVCFRMVLKPEIWKEDAGEIKRLFISVMGDVLKELKEKNGK